MVEENLRLKMYPEEILLKKTSEVEDVNEDIRTLCDNMRSLMLRGRGVGLAANQVGMPVKLFVTEELDIINPVILNRSKETISTKEGCLSFPTIRMSIPRSEEIEVEFLDREGNKQTEIFLDLNAIIIQHEYDHLMGKTFLDYAGPVKRNTILRKLKKWRRSVQRILQRR